MTRPILECAACDAKNRLPADPPDPGKTVRCGFCQHVFDAEDLEDAYAEDEDDDLIYEAEEDDQ